MSGIISSEEMSMTNASLTKLEREVLADPQAFLKYESLLRQGKRVEAVAALRFYVHLRKVHDSNSKSLKDLQIDIGSLDEEIIQEDFIEKHEEKMMGLLSKDEKVPKRLQNPNRSKKILERLTNFLLHMKLLTFYFLMFVLCEGIFVATDIMLIFWSFSKPQADVDFSFKLWSWSIIILPIFCLFLQCLWQTMFDRNIRNFTLLIPRLPVFHQIRNLRNLIGMSTIDVKNPLNYKIIGKIFQESIDSMVTLAFLSSAPQAINLLAHILSEMSFDWIILMKFFSSIAMTSSASSLLFFNNRVSRVQESLFSFKGFIIVLPFSLTINFVSILALTIAAMPSRFYAVALITAIISTNFLVVTLLLKRGHFRKEIPTEVEMSVYYPGGLTHLDLKKTAQSKAWTILSKSVAISWVAPCTVWSITLSKKSPFLPVSCFISLLWLVAGFIIMTSTQLIANSTENQVSGVRNFITEHFVLLVFGGIVPYSLAAAMLFWLGNPINLFKLSKHIPGVPVVQRSLIFDFFWNHDLVPREKIDTFKDAVSFAYKKKSNVFAQPDDFDTSLVHIAAYNKLLEEIDRMTLYKEDVEAKDLTGKSVKKILQVLDATSSSVDKYLLKKLNEKFEKIEGRPIPKKSKLQVAVDEFDLESFNLLIAFGAQTGELDEKGLTCLERLVTHLNKENPPQKAKSFSKVVDENGQTLLHVALNLQISGKVSVTESLLKTLVLDFGIDPKRKTNEGTTPLHLAVLSGSFSFVTFLLKNGADVNAADNSGHTPLHDAVTQDVKILDILIKHKAFVNVRNVHGSTPLHLAALWGYPLSVKKLLDHQADPSIQDNRGNSPAHDAAWGSQLMDRAKEKLKCLNSILVHSPNLEYSKNQEGKCPKEYLMCGEENLVEPDFVEL